MPFTSKTAFFESGQSTLPGGVRRRQLNPRKPADYDNEDPIEDDDEAPQIRKSARCGLTTPSTAQQRHDCNSVTDVKPNAIPDLKPELEHQSDDDWFPVDKGQRRLNRLLPESNPFAKTDEQKIGIFIPRWAMAVTTNDAEQKLLGYIAYWMDKPEGHCERIAGRFCYENPIDSRVYWLVTAAFIGCGLRKSKTQIHRLIANLRRKRLIVAERHERRDRQYCYRLRLNWPAIKDEVAARRSAELRNDPTTEPW